MCQGKTSYTVVEIGDQVIRFLAADALRLPLRLTVQDKERDFFLIANNQQDGDPPKRKPGSDKPVAWSVYRETWAKKFPCVQKQ
jgi:hypothetical protein